MKKILFALCVAALATGCKAQVHPVSTGQSVDLQWTVPSAANGWKGCTAAVPCSFIVYRNASSGTDPLTSANWVQIATATGTSYLDATAAGTTAFYTVQLVQAGQYAPSSNVVGPFSPAAAPLAASLSGTTSAKNEAPLISSASHPQIASNDLPGLWISASIR